MEQQNHLPATMQVARLNVTEAYPLQLKLYQGLRTSSVSTMVKAQTPTIAEIKNKASETDARALLYIAVCEVCDFFNVGKNINDVQVATTVEMIIESFWHLKLEEVKYCFRRAMRTERLFDRLDGNIILGWLRTYDEERTEEAIRISEQEATEEVNAHCLPAPGAISYEEYMAILERQAAAGDKEAQSKLKSIRSIPKSGLSPDKKQAENDHKFKIWKTFHYLPNKKK